MSTCENLGDLALGIRCPEGHLTYRKTRISQNPRKPEIRPNLANDPVISNKPWQNRDSKRNRRFWTDSFRTHLNAPFWPQACGIRTTWTGVDSLGVRPPAGASNGTQLYFQLELLWSFILGKQQCCLPGLHPPLQGLTRILPSVAIHVKYQVECLCMGQSISPSLLWSFSHTYSKTLCFQS